MEVVLVVPGVPVRGVGPEGVWTWVGAHGTGVWCVVLWMEALYEAQSWRPKAAVRWVEQEEREEGESESVEWMVLCSNLSQCLSHAGNVYSDPHLQAEVS